MNIYEEKDVLKTFEVLIDRREQDTPKALKRYAAFRVPFQRATLAYGDYTYTATLPDGTIINDRTKKVFPRCVVERKMDLDELAQCFTRERERFLKEFMRAKANKAKVFLLVENGTFEGVLNHRYKSRYNPAAFLGSITAWLVRFDVSLIFCKEESSGRLIKELLYRDFKERLERGEYG